MKVAFQGVPGAYSELCIFEYFGKLGKTVSPMPCPSFDEAFEALLQEKADLAMMPIENSLGGTIHRNMDLLLRCPVHVIGEHNFRVRHCLLALPGSEKSDIKTVISHPQALAQCEIYIREHLGAVARSEADTAGSAEMIQQQQLKGYAAVASSLAAKVYGLKILDEGIEDESANYTRFLCLQRLPKAVPKPPASDIPMKTSIVFCLNGARMPGKLFKALSTFALRDISVAKIESRPMKNIENIIKEARPPLYYDFAALGSSGKKLAVRTEGNERAKFQYLFYVDVLSGVSDVRCFNALRHLGEVCSFMRILGTFPESLDKPKPEETDDTDTKKMKKVKSNQHLKLMNTEPLRILIVGFGGFGQFLAKTYVRQGHTVMGTSRGDYTAIAKKIGVEYKRNAEVKEFFARGVDVVLLATSIKSFSNVVKSLPWGSLKNPSATLVVDVLSVKIHAKEVLLKELPPTLDILCTHPMFGPESGKNGWDGLPFVYDKVRVFDQKLAERFLDTFKDEGCQMYSMSCEMHDSYAASSQFITHLTGRILSKLGINSTPINTKGFESLLKLVETTCKDSFDLFEGLYRHNVHSKSQLLQLRRAFEEMEDTLLNTGEEAKAEQKGKNDKTPEPPAQVDVNPNVAAMKPSATITIHSLANALKEKGEEVISLAVGEPNDTKCPAPIVEAAQKALATGRTYYTSSVGMLSLRKEICNKLKKDNGLAYSPGQIVCSNGAKQSIMQLVTALVKPADEVIVPAPYWTSYPDICTLAGCKPKIVRTEASDSYLLSAELLEASITPRTRILILCSPSNPTGSVYPMERLKELAAVLRKHPRVFVLSDEIYEYITYETARHHSIATLPGMYDRTAVVNGFSKGYAMTGFRLGYIAAPLKVAKLCAKVQGQITSCPSSISQHAGVAALTMGMGPVDAMRADFTKKRQFVIDFLAAIPQVTFSRPMGAFYVLPQISAYYGKYTPDRKKMVGNSTDFCTHLLGEYKVALVPGAGFGDDRCIRISYAGDLNELKTAMVRLKACLQNLVNV